MRQDLAIRGRQAKEKMFVSGNVACTSVACLNARPTSWALCFVATPMKNWTCHIWVLLQVSWLNDLMVEDQLPSKMTKHDKAFQGY